MIYILVDDFVKAKFFRCFMPNDNVIFLTNKLCCYLYLKFKSTNVNKVFYLRNQDGMVRHQEKASKQYLDKTIAVLNGRQTIDDAVLNYNIMYSAMQQTLADKVMNSDLLIVFNGNHASALAAVDYFKLSNGKVLYCEISNLPGKMIFDKNGVNAQSLLYEKPEILDELPSISEKEHEDWLSEYISYKNKPIPQAKINIITYAIIAIDDLVARVSKKAIKEDSMSFADKVSMFFNKFKSKKLLLAGESADLACEYVFYPTQVTSDTQLRINSEIDNFCAIKKIIANEPGRNIFVKIHPAESNIETINYFNRLFAQKKIKLVSNNTVELIRNAKKVYTINSTVGLETLIFGNNLTVFGRAIYSGFNEERLKKYVHQYLIDLDYFGDNVITQKHIHKLIKLSEL